MYIYKMAATIIKTLGKLGVAGGSVYATAQAGVWSSENTLGSNALRNARRTVFIGANDYLQQIPSQEVLRYSVGMKWNSGVKTVFGYILESPTTVSYYSRKAFEKGTDALSGYSKNVLDKGEDAGGAKS